MKDIQVMEATVEVISNTLRNSHERDNPDAGQIILTAIMTSDRCWAATVDGEIACVWGVTYVNIILGHVYLWVHMTKVGEANALRFLRKAKEFVDQLAKEYRLIYGHLDPRRAQSKRWLQWLGFTFGPLQELRDVTGKVHLAEVFTRGER